MCRSFRGLLVLGVLAVAGLPAAAEAQIVGVGPRFSFVRGDLATSTPTTRFVGGTLRLKTSGNVSLEGSMDMRTTWNTGKTERIRETPLQGSVLVYPLRSVIAPYGIAGMGIYSRNHDIMGTNGAVTSTTQDRKVGMHLGFGGELRIARHAAAFLDYRYRFVKFGDETSTNTTPGLSLLKFSHQGAMWTGGVSFVF
jgi:opacity protein-like surface antigen